MGFTQLHAGAAATGAGSVTCTFSSSTVNSLLVATVFSPSAGIPFTAPTGWKLAASSGAPPILFGTNNPSWGPMTSSGVTGLTTAIQYPSGVTGKITEGIPVAWPTGNFNAGVITQILELNPDVTDTLSGALDSNWTALFSSAPNGSWLMPYHECNLPQDGVTPAQVNALDNYLLALKNSVNPTLKYGRGCSTSYLGRLPGYVTPGMDFYGMDGYQHSDVSKTATSVFGPLLSAIRAVQPGAPVAIIETGTALDVTTWFNEIEAYAIANDIFCVQSYWTAQVVSGGGSQPWSSSFTTEMNAVSAALAVADAQDAEVWYYPDNPGGITSATFSNASGANCRGSVSEYSTAGGTTQALDGVPGVAAGLGSTTSFPVTTPGPTASGADLAIAAYGNLFSSAPGAGTWTAPGGMTLIKSLSSGATNLFASYYQIGPASGVPDSATGTFSTSTNQTGWGAVLALFAENVSISITTSTTLTGGTAGTAYAGVTLAVTGGTGPYSWAVISGALPAGILLSSGGVLSTGTPTLPGTYTFTVQVTDVNSHTASKLFTLIVAPGVTGGGAVTFPGSPLPLLIEILVNGTWTDITAFCYQRDGITITGGATAEGSTPSPAQATITLNNRDGRFSPTNVSGTYYPYLQRNIQLRISVVAAESVTGVTYTGYRFWGTVAEWPPLADQSANDVYVQVTANGPLRQISQGGGKGGALFRYYQNLAQQDSVNNTFYAPIAYWPCEEDPQSTVIGAGIDGGQDMAVTTGMPLWKAISPTYAGFNGSAPIPVVNNSTWDGLTGSFGSSGDDLFTGPGTYHWVASTTSVNAICIGAGGSGTKGQEGSGGGAGGGGGEYAAEATLAVTPGTAYQVVVGAGGVPGFWGTGGNPGGVSTMTGDAVTVTAHGGGGAGDNGTPGGTGGTGSSNTVHHNGGAGGNNGASLNGGAGGGSSGGSAAGGNTGSNSVSGFDAPGGAPVLGGGGGGTGGYQVDGQPGQVAGGGGGAGWANQSQKSYGGAGAAGSVELIYTPGVSGVPPNNVTRFIMLVPSHGGNNGAVLVRALSVGTIARLDCLYISSGKVQLKGYDIVGSLLFTSSTLTVGNLQPVMISMELVNNNSSGVNYTLTAVAPGATSLIGTVTGTQGSAVIGKITEVLVAPNADVTKTAIGHISVQYALIPLLQVSDALNGHYGEMGIDRFIRLCGEAALGNETEFNESADHWGFEGGTQSWAAASNCTIATSGVTVPGFLPGGTSWPTSGTQSLLVTSTGIGTFATASPNGLAGQPVNPGDIVSAAADVYVPVSINDAYIGIRFFNTAGTTIQEWDSTPVALTGGQVSTLKMKHAANPLSAYFNIHVGNSDAASPATTLLYVDNVRVSPQMGTQTRDDFRNYLEQVKDLEQGMLKEAKDLWGLKYKTRISLINQNPVLSLDFNAGELSAPPEPVADDKLTVNQVTVKRTEGSRVTVSQSSGQMNTGLPPGGVGKYGKQAKVAASDDAQLIALAAHLLNLGTDITARYPVISVNLSSTNVAADFANIANVEIGDFIQVINLPFWYPDTIAKQLVIGYTETLNAYTWTIDWNCTPETPYEITASSLRRW